MATGHAPITEHPDLLDLHDRFERIAETPSAQIMDGLTVLAGLYWPPLADVSETDAAYLVEIDLSGADKSDVNIDVIGSELSVTG